MFVLLLQLHLLPEMGQMGMESFSVPLHSGSFGGPQMGQALCHRSVYPAECHNVPRIIQGENNDA